MAAATQHGVRVADLEWLLGVSRKSLHRDAEKAGAELTDRPRRMPADREGWKALITEHGTSPTKLARALGLAHPGTVRTQLIEHGLLETWWGRRGTRLAEWADY